jgi:hypothetical protein
MSPSLHIDATEPALSFTPSQDGGVLFDLENDRLLKLSAVGVEIWKLLTAGESEPQIVLQIAERYGVDQSRVAKDVRALLGKITELRVPITSSVSTNQPQSATPENRPPSFPWYGQDASARRPKPRPTTVLCALLGLAAFDFVLTLFSLKSLCSVVRRWPLRRSNSVDPEVVGRTCSAVEKACVWYPKQALCLQRSAVTACLLRVHGIPARMTIGARPMPLLAHAWVEVEGAVVNDWAQVKSFYGALTSY